MLPVFTLLALIEALETQPNGRGTRLAATLRALPPDADVAKIAEALCPPSAKHERFYRVLRSAGMTDKDIDEVWRATGTIPAIRAIRVLGRMDLLPAKEMLCSALGVTHHMLVSAFNDRERNT
jgi:hypothetical protein